MRYVNFNSVDTIVMFSNIAYIHIHFKTLCSFVLNSFPRMYIQLFSECVSYSGFYPRFMCENDLVETIEDETVNDSDVIDNSINYEDGQ